MLFNSLAFVVFFPIAVGVYFLTPHKWRWAWLLAASYVFYGWWRVDYLALIVGSTLIDYWVGLRMGAQATKKARKPYLWISLIANLGLLFSFKYLGFFGETANAFLSLTGQGEPLAIPRLLLPVGISFYTFQTLSYSVDVYRGEKEPERHLGIFALYVSFFPQLVAGPIERSRRLLPQFREEHHFDPVLVSSGLRLMLWGFFVKCVVADRLAPYVDAVYVDPAAFSGAAAWASSYAFAWQIYGDFAGYSLIAIGAARVMGFRLMDNFRRPFLANSLDDLWRRWHISLMSWFRDYIYRPLGGGKKGKARGLFNLMLVFLASGIWHGAAWTFVLFGAVQGALVIGGKLTQKRRSAIWNRLETWSASLKPLAPEAEGTAVGPTVVASLRRFSGAFFAFNLFALATPFFRGRTMEDALAIYRNHLVIPAGTHSSAWLPGFDGVDMLLIVMALGAFFAVDLFEESQKRPIVDLVGDMPLMTRWAVYIGVSLIVVLFGSYGAVPFIYFQF